MSRVARLAPPAAVGATVKPFCIAMVEVAIFLPTFNAAHRPTARASIPINVDQGGTEQAKGYPQKTQTAAR